MENIIYDFFIRFYDHITDNPRTERTITHEMFESMQINLDYANTSLKTINCTLKNPNNIFTTDSPNPSGENIFGDTVETNWSAYFIPDAKFFVAKGTPTDFDTASDIEKDRRLLGIFRIDEAPNDMIGQKISIMGRDTMKYAQVAVAYSYPNVIKYPTEDWAVQCTGHPRTWTTAALMSVGQIVHDIFHKMGVYHLHKTGVIDCDFNGSLWDDGTIFWSTTMFFDAANQNYADEQVFNLIHPYDFINKFVDYTGYRFYVWDTIVDGIPRPVFVFRNPTYTDGTNSLFGVSNILYYNETLLPYHRYPLMTLGLIYKKSDNDVRGYIFVATKDEVAIAENTGDSGDNMQWKNWRIGIVVEPSLVSPKDVSFAKGIAQSIMSQSMHNYREMSIVMNDFVRFGNNVYNFNISLDEPYIRITANYSCSNITWSWQSGNAYTSASFKLFSNDTTTPVEDQQFVIPIEVQLIGIAGDTMCSLSWSQLEGAGAYQLYRDGTIVYSCLIPATQEPITYNDINVNNGTSYTYWVITTFQDFTTTESNRVTLKPLTGLVGGGGGGKQYNVR